MNDNEDSPEEVPERGEKTILALLLIDTDGLGNSRENELLGFCLGDICLGLVSTMELPRGERIPIELLVGPALASRIF